MAFRNAKAQTVERVGYSDLAAKPGVAADVESQLQRAFLQAAAHTHLFLPTGFDIDVTGAAGAGSAAVGIDAWDRVLHGRFHHGHAGQALDRLLSAILLYKCNLRHVSRYPRLVLLEPLRQHHRREDVIHGFPPPYEP